MWSVATEEVNLDKAFYKHTCEDEKQRPKHWEAIPYMLRFEEKVSHVDT